MTSHDTVFEFEVLLEPDGDGFHVWCPALKGCHSFGATREQAIAHIREAIEGWLEGAEEPGYPISERQTVSVTRH